ncbi:hypothetical protein [Streptomyces tsukubensis]|uniref:Uncharacterized protein n=1 Tax=Streptomyces tsukubensis TaxID=83656 RepID=A0A1V4A6S6_9ACTN|nr:hypothetical protein [Streptomyces tsukubensis]OON77958.1 hypothetical protein B1H18_17125 [Streptomyces tsukubensis]QFR97120.1 hypothetical protein GBW32_33780 [Streptomyces tsukubensis]
MSVTHAAHHIEVTAESLQDDLARLEVQKQSLERELAAVVAHLSSVQRALGALQVLMSPAGPGIPHTTDTPGAPPRTAEAAAHGEPARPAKEPHDATSTAAPTATSSAGNAHQEHSPARPEDHDAAPESSDKESARKNYGRLTEQILHYFAEVGDVDVRARDVAAALGRATDSGSINAVRSTLDRLVGSSRIRRTGRGLYRAV